MKVRFTLTLDEDLVKWMRKTGHVQRTDLAGGRYNWSSIANGYFRQFIAQQEPVVIAKAYLVQRDEKKKELLEIEERARQDLGTTIDDFLRSHGEVLEKAQDRASRILAKIRQEFGRYNGSNLESWIKSRYETELKFLGMKAKELAETLQGVEDDGHQRA